MSLLELVQKHRTATGAAGRRTIEQFVATHFADDLKGPPKVLSGGGHSFSDDVRKLVKKGSPCHKQTKAAMTSMASTTEL